jgi:hypothetical protein
MLAVLLLAATLAGPPPPTDWIAKHEAEHAEIKKVADGIALDLTFLGIGISADLLSTSAAIKWCPTCYEGNPGGWDSEARVALKLGMASTIAIIEYELRRHGLHTMATVLRYIAFGVQMSVATSNTVHAIRGE